MPITVPGSIETARPAVSTITHRGTLPAAAHDAATSNIRAPVNPIRGHAPPHER